MSNAQRAHMCNGNPLLSLKEIPAGRQELEVTVKSVKCEKALVMGPNRPK